MEKIKRNNMVFSVEEIKERLPHRYPFLMVDRIIETKPGKCTGIKNVTINECYFLGHFPQQAIMPGNLITESMAQVAAFVGHPPEEENTMPTVKKGYLVATNMKFHKPVIPGDQLIISVKVIKRLGKLTMFEGEVKVDGEIVANGGFTVADIS
ncbi:MAG: 3-hydroxyacyl-ACP dehydratase FabZ [bacterium]|nr:3-hydroxyacyl-ACP dehydratase FabZ [bacterium]